MQHPTHLHSKRLVSVYSSLPANLQSIMQSFFCQRTENEQDLLRVAQTSSGSERPRSVLTDADWQFLSEPVLNILSPMRAPAEDLGDPFFEEMESMGFFDGPSTRKQISSGGGGSLLDQKILCEGPSSITSKMPQTPSPSRSQTVIKPTPFVSCNTVKMNTGLAGYPNDGRMHASPPQRTLGIKRRKGLAKKVISIPAPAAASSRPGGEVVPSDSWAWRKYGQKPIKGSPYPRGYYRCSSSKGCSARKQVERSQTDPSMLVITYTSEHNHPQPTQRNALAGSTRSNPSNTHSSASRNPPSNQRRPTSLKEELDKTTSSAPLIEVEVQKIEKAMTKDNDFEDVFHQSYEFSHFSDFFAEFKELESDPMSLIFSKGLLAEKADDERKNKNLDTFNFSDW